MSGSTNNEGFPYPLTSDFVDVQDAYRLAAAVDEEIRSEQQPFRDFLGRPSFIARSTVNGSTFLSGTNFMTFGAVDWDNTGGAVVGQSLWRQPTAQPPSWWLFGATLLEFPSGGATLGDAIMGQLSISTIDQVTGGSSTVRYYQRNDESGTNGEWINVFGMAPIYRGTVSLALKLNGVSQKGIQAGSRLWGMYLGPVV